MTKQRVTLKQTPMSRLNTARRQLDQLEQIIELYDQLPHIPIDIDENIFDGDIAANVLGKQIEVAKETVKKCEIEVSGMKPSPRYGIIQRKGDPPCHRSYLRDFATLGEVMSICEDMVQRRHPMVYRQAWEDCEDGLAALRVWFSFVGGQDVSLGGVIVATVIRIKEDSTND